MKCHAMINLLHDLAVDRTTSLTDIKCKCTQTGNIHQVFDSRTRPCLNRVAAKVHMMNLSSTKDFNIVEAVNEKQKAGINNF